MAINEELLIGNQVTVDNAEPQEGLRIAATARWKSCRLWYSGL